MRSIAEVAGSELLWVQPSMMHQAFELRAGDEVVATLAFQRSSLATAQTAEQSWTFKREGFWHPHVTARVADSDQNLAVFRPHWMGGGTLDLGDAGQLRFGAANFWHTQWDWQTSQGKSLVHFKSQHGFLKSGAQVEIEPDEATNPDLPLLVVLGWYLLVLFARDAAAASSAGGVAAMGGAT
jgi:hypothetical protein